MRLWFFNMCNSFFIVICHHLFSWYLSRIHFHFLMSLLAIRIIYTIFLITCYHSFLPYVPWRKGIIKPLYSIQIRKVLTYEIKTEVLNIFAPLRFSPFFCTVNKMRGNAPPCFPGGRLVKWKTANEKRLCGGGCQYTVLSGLFCCIAAFEKGLPMLLFSCENCSWQMWFNALDSN